MCVLVSLGASETAEHISLQVYCMSTPTTILCQGGAGSIGGSLHTMLVTLHIGYRLVIIKINKRSLDKHYRIYSCILLDTVHC